MKIRQHGLQGMGQIRPKPLETNKIPQEVRNVAGNMESLFVKHLFEKMRETVPKNEKEDMITSFYSKLLDGERAKMISLQGNGLGLKKIIAEQLMKGNHSSY